MNQRKKEEKLLSLSMQTTDRKTAISSLLVSQRPTEGSTAIPTLLMSLRATKGSTAISSLLVSLRMTEGSTAISYKKSKIQIEVGRISQRKKLTTKRKLKKIKKVESQINLCDLSGMWSVHAGQRYF
jgi:hypothetical protein